MVLNDCQLLYACNSEKNTECSKRHCYEDECGCHLTPNIDFAKLYEESNEPIIDCIIYKHKWFKMEV